MVKEKVGFIGIGNMGQPISKNLSSAGYDIIGYDLAGTKERIPKGAKSARSSEDVAKQSELILLSLPDGNVVQEVVGEVLEASDRKTTTIIDLSTSGVEAARNTTLRCQKAEMEFYDAPVSGGVSGAIDKSISIMFAGPNKEFQMLKPLLETIGRPFLVGSEPGQGQAMKLINNFLSATSMVATSEAISLGEHIGLDIALMIDVLNASSGRNDATVTKFPKSIIPKTYDRGFSAKLMQKDLDLYRSAQLQAGTPGRVSQEIIKGFREFNNSGPEADITRIYPFIKDGGYK